MTCFKSAMAVDLGEAMRLIGGRPPNLRHQVADFPGAELMAVRASPDWRTRATPSSTLAVLEEIRRLISLAASADR